VAVGRISSALTLTTVTAGGGADAAGLACLPSPHPNSASATPKKNMTRHDSKTKRMAAPENNYALTQTCIEPKPATGIMRD